ncbi:MAG: TIGR03663 family protein [Candidatus Hydrogenedentes bacterium]|nr:TIGR03663 family protein [Candidatus Hydrogenedentota bacterium]
MALRLPRLFEKPFHGDEANQAVKAGILLDTGVYHYDPHDHHGPTLYYLTLPVMWLSGESSFADTTETTYRIVPVLFGVALILLLLLTRDALGNVPLVIAALLTAISPAMVYYSRYYIQEMLLVFFTLGALACGWRYAQRPSWGWAIACGVSLALMHATKETCILAFAAMAGGLALTALYARWSEGQWPALSAGFDKKRLAVAAIVAIVVSVTFFSSFFTHARGPLDSIGTYLNYFRRAGGAGMHDKPWYYYLETLLYTRRTLGTVWSEGLIVVFAVIGGFAALTKRLPVVGSRRFLQFLTFYTLLLTCFHAIIPYKTPWSMLSFLHGMILMAAVGMYALVNAIRWKTPRAAIAVLIALGLAHLSFQAYRASYVYAADKRNPYVYAHTSMALLKLVDTVEDLADLHPDGYAMRIDVVEPTADYWPLPFYLRKFTRVGYWTTPPPRIEAPVVIASTPAMRAMAEALADYDTLTFSLRPGELFYLNKAPDFPEQP